jgi:hypothetical protein
MPTTFDDAGWAGIEAECEKTAVRVTALVAADAHRGCPIDTGELDASIHTSHPEKFVGRAHVGTDHWWPTEYGSLPHEIRARTPGGILAFYWVREGRWFFGPRVHHPGTPAQPFMRPAIYTARAL